MANPKQARLELFRTPNEPILKIGDFVELKDGSVGIVLARFTPIDRQDDVGYVIERAAATERQRS
jgi:hypothetical protein